MMLWSVFPAYAGMIRLALVDAFLAVVFPAYAGMIPTRHRPTTRRPSVPRIRGDDPSTSHTLGTSGSCSPHTRG